MCFALEQSPHTSYIHAHTLYSLRYSTVRSPLYVCLQGHVCVHVQYCQCFLPLNTSLAVHFTAQYRLQIHEKCQRVSTRTMYGTYVTPTNHKPKADPLFDFYRTVRMVGIHIHLKSYGIKSPSFTVQSKRVNKGRHRPSTIDRPVLIMIQDMYAATAFNAENYLLNLLESENWDSVGLFLEQGRFQLSREKTLVECMELAMLAVRKAPDFLLPLLIERIDLKHIFPSMRSDFDLSKVYCTPLLHNVCLDHKHEAMALVLSSLGPEFAQREATRFDHVSLLLGEDKLHWDYDFLYTPIQTAWETLLVDDFPQAILNITSLEDLGAPSNTNLLNLWLTSMYLLMAMDGQPITTLGHRPTLWSVPHAIARAGHLMHSALMWLALKFYPDSFMNQDTDGNSILHIIASNSTYYRSHVRLHQQQRADHGGSFIQTQVNEWEQSPLQMVLATGNALASVPDKIGRLPIHLILVNYEKTTKQFKALKEQQHDFDSECGFTLNVQESLDELLQAYPSAIQARDPQTTLLPFMLAASVPDMPLDIIYNLLIRDPTLVSPTVTCKRKVDATSRSNVQRRKRKNG